MTPAEFTRFLEQILVLCSTNSIDGSIHFVFIDWRHVGELIAAGKVAYDELKNICVWTKTTPGQGTFYRSQHEFVCVFKRGQAPHLNNFELGQHGRTRSNVWHYPGVNTFRAGRMDELRSTPRSSLLRSLLTRMRDCSKRGDIVLDVFAGSGTTIMAAEQIGRRAFCMEIDPAYVDVAIERWQRFTRRDAILEETGETFDDLRSRRGGRVTAELFDRADCGGSNAHATLHRAWTGRAGALRTTADHRLLLRHCRGPDMGRSREMHSRSPATQKPRVKLNGARTDATHSTVEKGKAPGSGDEKVGYGRPPKEHQFKSGQSGNPSGGRKGAKSEAAILREILSRKVTIRQGDRARKIPLLEAIILKMVEEALHGDLKATSFLLNRVRGYAIDRDRRPSSCHPTKPR